MLFYASWPFSLLACDHVRLAPLRPRLNFISLVNQKKRILSKSLLYIPVCEPCPWRQIRDLKYCNVSHVIIVWASHIRGNKGTQFPKRKLGLWFQLLFCILVIWLGHGIRPHTFLCNHCLDWHSIMICSCTCISICSEKYLKTRWHGITRHGGGLGKECVLINFSVQWDVAAK